MVNLRILLLIISFTPLQIFSQTTSGGGEFCAEKSSENAEFASGAENNLAQITKEADSLSSHDGGATAKLAATLKSQVTSCGTKKNVADWACVETCSPAVKSFTDEWGGTANIAAMVGGSGLIGDKCGAIATALKTAQLALTAFQAACASGKAICTSSCTGIAPISQKVSNASMVAVNKAQATMAAACATLPNPECAPATKAYESAIVAMQGIVTALGGINNLGKLQIGKCDNYKEAKNNAMAGALLAIQGMKTAETCEKKTSNQVAAVDCSTTSSPGYNTPNCQCARGEKSAAECQSINVNSASIKQGAISIPNTAANASGENSITAPMDLSPEQQVLGPQASTPSGAAMPIDGGGAGMGGGGGGTGGAQDGALAPKRFNTNILGGGFGGGGGGGGSGGGPGYGEMDSQLKSYMPGEKNDPNRSVASQLAKEVTPQAGRTNWEKVRLRYRDHYSSLLNK